MLAFSSPLDANIMAKPNLVTLMKRFVYEVQQNGNVDIVKEIVDEDFIDHSGPQGQDSGPVYATKLISHMHLALTDIKIEIMQCMSEGKTVATHKIIRAVQKGEFMGRPATGRPIEMDVMDFVVIVNGRFKEHWSNRGEIVDR